MFKGINHKEAIALFWAFQWRWILIYIFIALPLFWVKTIPHTKNIDILYEVIDLSLIFLAFYICVVLILNKGYGKNKIEICKADNESSESES